MSLIRTSRIAAEMISLSIKRNAASTVRAGPTIRAPALERIALTSNEIRKSSSTTRMRVPSNDARSAIFGFFRQGQFDRANQALGREFAAHVRSWNSLVDQGGSKTMAGGGRHRRALFLLPGNHKDTLLVPMLQFPFQ